VVNETDVYDIPALEVDSDVHFILDSAIHYTKQCEYFDDRIPYLHAFFMSYREVDGDLLYSINANKSIESALGVRFNKFLGRSDFNRGAFFYKNYLFTFPVYGKEKEESSPFKALGYDHRIAAAELFNEKTYDSYIDFAKRGNKYEIVKNGICGSEILIR